MFAGQRNTGLPPVLPESCGEAEDQGTLRDIGAPSAAAAPSAARPPSHHTSAAAAAHGIGRRHADAEGAHHEPGTICNAFSW